MKSRRLLGLEIFDATLNEVIEYLYKIIKEGKKTTVCTVEIKRKTEIVAIAIATGYNVGTK